MANKTIEEIIRRNIEQRGYHHPQNRYQTLLVKKINVLYGLSIYSQILDEYQHDRDHISYNFIRGAVNNELKQLKRIETELNNL